MEIPSHRNTLCSRINAEFEADNEIDISSIGNRTTNNYKQNPVPNGYYMESELDDNLKSGYYKSLLGCDNVDWFVNEVIKLENKTNFYLKKTQKVTIMTEEEKDDFDRNIICQFCTKNFESDKMRDRCHSTGKYRGPAHNNCNINVT